MSAYSRIGLTSVLIGLTNVLYAFNLTGAGMSHSFLLRKDSLPRVRFPVNAAC